MEKNQLNALDEEFYVNESRSELQPILQNNELLTPSDTRKIILFIDYFNANYLNSDSSISDLQKLAVFCGYVLAPLSVALGIPYGYQFGSEQLGLDDEVAQKVVGSYFAVVGTLALAALSLRVVPNAWKAMVKPVDDTEKYLTSKDRGALDFTVKAIYQGVTITSGFISATPNLILTHQTYSKISTLFALPFDFSTYVTLATVRSWAIQKVLGNVFTQAKFIYLSKKNKNSQKNALAHRLLIRNKLIAAKTFIEQCEAEDAEIVFNTFYSGDLMILNYSEALIKLKIFLNPMMNYNLSSHAVNKESWTRWLFRMSGSIIAALYPYPGYVLAAEMSDDIWNYFGVASPWLLDSSAVIFGVVSYACIAALGAIAVNDIFALTYDTFLNFPSIFRELKNVSFNKKDVISHFLSFVFVISALSSAAPRVDIGIEYTPDNFYRYLVVFCTAVSAFSTDFWALIGYKNELMFGKSKKQQLVGMYSKMISVLPEVGDSILYRLGRTLEKIDNIPEEECSNKLEELNLYNIDNFNQETIPFRKKTYSENLDKFGLFEKKNRTHQSRGDNFNVKSKCIVM